MNLTVDQLTWLTLVRYQTVVAVEQSRQPPPASALAINGLQDALESFLKLCAEHLPAVETKKDDFLTLFDSVANAPALTSPIGHYRNQLNSLNKARVNFKHHGNIPHATTLERHRVNAMNFLQDVCKIVLECDFDDISLSGLIHNQKARTHLHDAEIAFQTKDFDSTGKSLRLSLDSLLQDYEERKTSHYGDSLFRTQPSFTPRSLGFRDLDRVLDWVKSIDERTKLLSFGVNIRQYMFFDSHTPQVVYTNMGVHFLEHNKVPTLTEGIFRRCHKFIIDTALMLNSDDYDFNGSRLYLEGRETNE